IAVVGSGALGAFFYTSVPRRLTEVESDNTPADLASQLRQLAASMVRLATGRSLAFQQVCSGLLAETIPGRLAGWRLMLRRRGRAAWRAGAPGGGGTGAAAAWAVWLKQVPAGEQEDLRQLLVMSRQRGELLDRLAAQQRFRNLLGAWLYLHVP